MKEYGTVGYYADMIADLIADVQYDNPQFGDNLIAGFNLAIDEWRKYHADQVIELDRIKEKLDD